LRVALLKSTLAISAAATVGPYSFAVFLSRALYSFICWRVIQGRSSQFENDMQDASGCVIVVTLMLIGSDSLGAFFVLIMEESPHACFKVQAAHFTASPSPRRTQLE
jgi:hypothetical protein